MVRRVLQVLLLFISLTFAGVEKLDYELRQLVSETSSILRGTKLKLKGVGEVGEVKVLRRDGTVEVVNLSKRNLKELMDDPDIIYIEAPRPVRLKNDIVRDTSYGLYGTGNQTISITDPGRTYRVYISPYGTPGSFTGTCTNLGEVFGSQLLECSGNVDINITASGDFRMVVVGADSSNISGYTEAYLVGTKSLNTTNDGTGVVVGIIDSGINFCHPAFLDSSGNTRVKFLGFALDQNTANQLVNKGKCTSSDPATCCNQLGGTYDSNTQICELNETVINQKISAGDCTGWDDGGHGTHVAGIAAGSDLNNIFGIGVAPGADLVVFSPITASPNYSSSQLVDTVIIKGLEWIKQKAQQLGKPAAVNMSLGYHFDPHDGTGLLDKKIDQLSGPGFIVVVAQSNEGDKPLHAFTTKTSDTVRIRVPEVKDQNNNLVGYVAFIMGWYKNPSQWRIEVCEPGTSNCVETQSGNDRLSPQAIGNTGCQAKVLASITNDPLNGDGRFQIDIVCQSSTDLEIRLSQICGEVARVDMWDVKCDSLRCNPSALFQSNFEQDSLGGYKFTVASPGTAKRAITVGAINSRPGQNTEDTFLNLGKIANFSSRGPTRDGRIKPNVVAGGAWVISADASYPNDLYKPYQGTSMATPVVTGLVALYLQSNPNATPEDVKKWLTSNAVQDVGSLTYPNITYGYGKAVWASSTGAGGSSQDPTVSVAVGSGLGKCQAPSQTSGGGGGGCSTGGTSALVYVLVSLLVILGLRRRLFS